MGERLAQVLALPFIFIYLLCSGRGLSRVNLNSKMHSYFMSKVNLLWNSRGMAIRDMQGIRNHRQDQRDTGRVSFSKVLGTNLGRLF